MYESNTKGCMKVMELGVLFFFFVFTSPLK
jgi:hypothetical protein